MAGESSAPAGAVFLSYASEDAEAARRISEALRAGGIEVFLDQSELRGGDAWDQRIRHEIHECALFMPVVSAHTQQRLEGYFRHEWKLAVERTHHMAEQKPFLVPVVVDATREQEAVVPDAFRAVQWTRLPGGVTPPEFVERLRRLFSPELPARDAVSAPVVRGQTTKSSGFRRVLPAATVLVLLLGAAAYLALEKPWVAKTGASAFSPPPHSVAVLPFVNVSGDKEQEYFSDGLTEELLNSLAGIDQLQVAGRTSAFSFKGKDTDLGTIARQLNVGAILEGSVRRSGHTIRISTELINTVTGFQLWSKSYDRDLGDVLKLQTDIATSVAGALKVALLGDIAQKIELGGTRNPAAFDAYLRASMAYRSRHGANDVPATIALFTQAIQLDPDYALAFVGRSIALVGYAEEAASAATRQEGLEKAEADARRAIGIAPELADAHLALANALSDGALDFPRANEEYERAVALAPGDAQVLRLTGLFATYMGRFDAGIAALRRAVALDPLARSSHAALGFGLYAARQYAEAERSYAQGISLDPNFVESYADRGLAVYGLGVVDKARTLCEAKRDFWESRQCLAVVYEKVGRHADAQAELATFKAALGEAGAYQYATIFAQWGDHTKALDWLETALRLRDPGLINLKTDPLMDPLRQEPRFQAAMRVLRFPE